MSIDASVVTPAVVLATLPKAVSDSSSSISVSLCFLWSTILSELVCTSVICFAFCAISSSTSAVTKIISSSKSIFKIFTTSSWVFIFCAFIWWIAKEVFPAPGKPMMYSDHSALFVINVWQSSFRFLYFSSRSFLYSGTPNISLRLSLSNNNGFGDLFIFCLTYYINLILWLQYLLFFKCQYVVSLEN